VPLWEFHISVPFSTRKIAWLLIPSCCFVKIAPFGVPSKYTQASIMPFPVLFTTSSGISTDVFVPFRFNALVAPGATVTVGASFAPVTFSVAEVATDAP